MKHCDKDIDTTEDMCPFCGKELQDESYEQELDTDELVAAMTVTGIL